MARYGIDRALLAAQRPDTDQPADRIIDILNPWARVQAHLLCGLASAMRCQSVILPRTGPATRIHVFGFASDIERTEILYTSLLVQMWQWPRRDASARPGRAACGRGGAVGCWLHLPPSCGRVRAAEQRAQLRGRLTEREVAGSGHGAGAGRPRRRSSSATSDGPTRVTRKTRITYSGSGYGDGYAKGEQADLGAQRLRGATRRALGHGSG